jgi:hypothetical protein
VSGLLRSYEEAVAWVYRKPTVSPTNALLLKVKAMQPIDQMNEVQFATHRAEDLKRRGKDENPFVITAKLWLDLTRDIDGILLESDSLRQRLTEAEHAAQELRGSRETWIAAYEAERDKALKAESELLSTRHDLEEAHRRLDHNRACLVTAEARVAHLQRLGLDKEPSPG